MSYCTIMWITAWKMLSVCVSTNDSWLFLPCLPPLSSFIVYGNTLKPLPYMQSAGVCPSGPLQMVLCISQCQGPLICLTVSSLHADNRAQIQTRSTCWGLRKLLHVFFFPTVPDFFEDGVPLPAQAYLKVCSAVSEASLNDVKPSSPPAILGSPPKEAVLPSSGTTVQRRSVLHTEEIVRVFKTPSPSIHPSIICTYSMYAA